MTRGDLEEAIMNLEYLVVHHFDAFETKEFEALLAAFRLDLQSQTQQQSSMTGQPESRWRRVLERRRKRGALTLGLISGLFSDPQATCVY